MSEAGATSASGVSLGGFGPELAPLFADSYTLISELWCSPPEVEEERGALRKSAAEVVSRWMSVAPPIAGALERFIGRPALSDEEYIDLFELDPKCPLYLGAHSYEEPKTCAGAAVSDRNEYMIELAGIYKHFGRVPNGKELPDYLPLMVECLALTAGAANDPVRVKLVDEYIIPFLPPMRKKLQELGTSYSQLMEAFEAVVGLERGDRPFVETKREKRGEAHAG